jgi:crotonyl-CoA reductase
VELESSDGHDDTMLAPEQRIWGYETNLGGLAEITLVKSNQLMAKAGHLTWEEAAASGLVNSTAYRQLVSRNDADLKQGDSVLVWGRPVGWARTRPDSPWPVAPDRCAWCPTGRRWICAARWARTR